MGFLDEIFSGASGASGVTYPDAINAKPSNTDEIFSGASGASGVTYPDAINAKPSNTDDVCVDVCIYDASRDHAPHTPLTPHPITPEKCQTSNTEANLREIPVPCSPRIQKITRATNPDELVEAMADYIPGQLTDSELTELTKAYELKMAEFMPENQPILDPGGAIRAFNACRTTKELWEATCRIDPGDWPSEVFGRVWDYYTAVEGRLVEQGEPRVFHIAQGSMDAPGGNIIRFLTGTYRAREHGCPGWEHN